MMSNTLHSAAAVIHYIDTHQAQFGFKPERLTLRSDCLMSCARLLTDVEWYKSLPAPKLVEIKLLGVLLLEAP